MATDSWLLPHLEAVLIRGRRVLDNWRNIVPTLQGHVKNFENWMLVELSHELLEKQFAHRVLTNGFFGEGKDTLDPRRVKRSDISGLAGSKSKGTWLAADLCALVKSGECLMAEIKTGLSERGLLDDLRIVQHYNDARIAHRAELGWAVILPSGGESRRSCVKAFEKISRSLSSQANYSFVTKTIDENLIASVVAPISVPPNIG